MLTCGSFEHDGIYAQIRTGQTRCWSTHATVVAVGSSRRSVEQHQGVADDLSRELFRAQCNPTSAIHQMAVFIKAEAEAARGAVNEPPPYQRAKMAFRGHELKSPLLCHGTAPVKSRGAATAESHPLESHLQCDRAARTLRRHAALLGVYSGVVFVGVPSHAMPGPAAKGVSVTWSRFANVLNLAFVCMITASNS
jgi:hypothetical protein